MGRRFTGKTCRLVTMFAMTSSFFLVELVVGYVTNSMALVADSFHMLSDVLALIIAFLSIRMAPKKWSKNTFGWARAEVLGALVNSVFLLALCFSIFVESLKRLYEVEELHTPQLILCVGVLGLIVNLIGLALFHEHGHSHGGHGHGAHGHTHTMSAKHSTINTLVATDDNENDERFSPLPPSISIVGTEEEECSGGPKMVGASQMNMRGVFLHVLSDALGSVIVIISALVVWLSNWEFASYIDPALSLCLVALISFSTYPLFKDSAMILLQTVPTHIQVEGIEKRLRNVDGVLTVHEFHVWQLAGERIIASAHIRCRNLKDYMMLAEKIKKIFHEEGIHSTTIQPEFVEIDDLDSISVSINSTEDCIIDCPSNDKDGCVANTCCRIPKQVRHRITSAKSAPDTNNTEYSNCNGSSSNVRGKRGSGTSNSKFGGSLDGRENPLNIEYVGVGAKMSPSLCSLRESVNAKPTSSALEFNDVLGDQHAGLSYLHNAASGSPRWWEKFEKGTIEPSTTAYTIETESVKSSTPHSCGSNDSHKNSVSSTDVLNVSHLANPWSSKR